MDPWWNLYFSGPSKCYGWTTSIRSTRQNPLTKNQWAKGDPNLASSFTSNVLRGHWTIRLDFPLDIIVFVFKDRVRIEQQDQNRQHGNNLKSGRRGAAKPVWW